MRSLAESLVHLTVNLLTAMTIVSGFIPQDEAEAGKMPMPGDGLGLLLAPFIPVVSPGIFAGAQSGIEMSVGCPLASWVYQFRAGSLYQGLQLTALGLLSYRRLEGQDAVKIRSFDVGVGSITRGLEFHWGIFRLEREQALGIFIGAESIKRGGDKATTATLSIKLPIHPGNLSRRSVFDSLP